MSRAAFASALADLARREVTAHDWLLSEADELYFVLAGTVDCFLRRLSADGTDAGARHPYMSVAEGEILVGFSRDVPDLGLRVVRGPDTKIVAIAADVVLEAMADPALIDLLTPAVAVWAEESVRRHVHGLVPRTYRPARSGETLSLGAGEATSAVSGVTWARIVGGQYRWMDETAVGAGTGGGSTPVLMTGKLWVTAISATTVDTLETADLVAEGLLWDGLRAHHVRAVRRALDAWSTATEMAPERFASRLREVHRQRHMAIKELAGVVGARPGTEFVGEASLVGAMSILGRRNGLSFDFSKIAADRDLRAMATAKEIAAISRVRFREVILRDRWWTGDNGNLLVKSSDEEQWFAVTAERGGRSVLHCPATGAVRPVGATLTETLAPTALSFYRPFPDEAIKLLAIMRFALFGLRNDLVVVLLIGLASGLLGLALPVLNGFIVETVIPSGQTGDMLTIGAVLAAATLSTSLFSVTRSISMLRLESRMNASVQAAVWDRLLKLPTSFFNRFSAGDLSNRATGINTIRSALSGTTLSTILTSVFSTSNLALLFYYDSKVAAVALAVILVSVLMMGVIGYFKLRIEKQIAAAAGVLAGQLFEILSGVGKLRTAAAESRALYNWAGAYSHLSSLRFRAQRLGILDNTVFSGYQLVATAVIFAMVGMALRDPDSQTMSIGDFVAFNAAFGAFFGSMISMTDTVFNLLNIIPIYERAKPILEAVPEDTARKEALLDPQGLIEVSSVAFHYPDGPPVLKGVTMTIQPGEFVALVGPSGSGKSTLFRILLGFETPQSGTVHYDGREIGRLDLAQLRKQVGIVLQSGKLLAGDIYTNIAGASGISHEMAWDAARMVGLEQDIHRMPMGMHTVIGEGATTLSGGQRQRIMIARAIASRPRIVFFDEATSALDNPTQAIVSKSLGTLKATRVVIAHRLTTIMEADRIFVIDQGAFVQEGRYDELMAREGMFKDLVSRQIL